MPKPLALAAALFAFVLSMPAQGQDIKFGDDSGDYPFDAECDDRRFRGPAMATALTWTAVGKDAADCQGAFKTGRAALWLMEEAKAATSCSRVRWGDDSSDYANDGECDDLRFEGFGMASYLADTENGRDASDCRRLCEYGLIFLRDY